MMDDQLTPDEMKMIEELRATPRPKISPSRARSIHQQVMHELRTSPPAPAARPGVSQVIILRTAAALAAAIVILFAVSQLGNSPSQSGGTPTILPPSNQVAVLPSDTPVSATAVAEFTVTPNVPVETTLLASAVPSITPSAQANIPGATPPEAIVVIEGQVSGISGNIITVNGFDVEVAPNHPILQIIEVGDPIHIEGALGGSGKIIPSIVSNLSGTTANSGSTPVTVGLDGPVEAIKDNMVTVNGIPVQFDPNAPVLKTLQVGDFVRVQGNFSGSGATIVLVVVNVTVFNDVTIINNTCWFDPGPPDDGMGMSDPAMGMEDPGMGMGHWHCDGMGMGDPAMGMADDGMGMGEPPPPPGMGG